MSQNKLERLTPIRFEDPSGQTVGEARAETAFPLKYTLFDERQQVVLVLDAVRVRGLLYDYLIHDARGAVLASLELKPNSWGRDRGVTASSWGMKYGITIGGLDAMLLAANASGSLLQLIELGSGAVLATCTGEWSVRTSRTQIDVSETVAVDHRIVLGAFLLLTYQFGSHRY